MERLKHPLRNLLLLLLSKIDILDDIPMIHPFHPRNIPQIINLCVSCTAERIRCFDILRSHSIKLMGRNGAENS